MMENQDHQSTPSAHGRGAAHPEDLPLPMELSIDDDPGEGKRLTFSRTLRLLPGKRLVGSGSWGASPVLIKLFYGKNPEKYWRREDRGSRILQSSPAAAPKLLHSGQIPGEDWFIVILEWVDEAQTLDEAWSEAPDDNAREDLLRKLVDHIAANHRAGVLQDDMHFSNFLLAKGVIYSIDGAQVKEIKQLRKSQALRNLAQLFAALPLHMQPIIPRLFQHYQRALGELVGHTTSQEILNLTSKVRRRRARRYLKKMFRNCTAIKADRVGSRQRLYTRNHAPALGEILTPSFLDEPSNTAKILKQGNSSTVWVGEIGAEKCTVKRYNVKNALHGIKLALRESRALKSWRNAHRLSFYGIHTAKPMAAILEKSWLFTRRAWFVSDFIVADDAATFFSADHEMTAAETLVARRICRLIALMGQNRISHGDLKATNILIRDGEPFLIDLDSLQQHATHWLARRKVVKDHRRFLANWQDRPILRRQFKAFLQQYSAPDNPSVTDR